MPELPGYEARQNLKATTAAPLRNEAKVPFEQDQKVFQTMQEVGKKLSDAHDEMAFTNAKSSYAQAQARIDAMRSRDSGLERDANGALKFVDNSKKYSLMLEDAKKEALKGVSNPMYANKLNAELELNNFISNTKTTEDFTKKRLEFNKTQVQTVLDGELLGIVNTNSPSEKMNKMAGINMFLNSQVDKGLLTPQEAIKSLRDSQMTAAKYEIYNDPARTEEDSQVLKRLRDPNDAYYKGFDPETRLKLIEESQRRVFQNNQTFKRQVEVSQSQRNDAFIEKLGTGTATFQDIDAEEAIPESEGGMPRKVLFQYRKYMQTGVEKTLNDMLREKNENKDATRRAVLAKEYNDLIENYLDSKTDQWKAKELLAKGLADGQIDTQEARILTPLRNGLRDIAFNKDTSPVAWTVKKVKEFLHSSNASNEEIALSIKQMLGSISEGEQPQAAMVKIMDQTMIKHFPDYRAYPKEGKMFVDNDTGRKYKVYPDGKWGWVE